MASAQTDAASSTTQATTEAVAQAGSTATASRARWACPKYRLCVWTGKRGTGVRAVFTHGDVNLADATGPKGMNNKIRSYRNRTGRNWSFHNGTNYNGTTRWAHPHTYGYVGQAMDRKTSSIKKR